jgi:hypothetical protein
VLESRISAGFAKWSTVVVKMMGAALLAFLSWRLRHSGGSDSKFGETTQQLLISFEPFYYLLAIAAAIYAVVLLLDIWQLVRIGQIAKIHVGDSKL